MVDEASETASSDLPKELVGLSGAVPVLTAETELLMIREFENNVGCGNGVLPESQSISPKPINIHQ